MPDLSDLDPEDAKLVTLARAARARTGAVEGAAVRDGTGRTYAAVSVALPSLSLSALQAAVVMAVASGAASLEAGAIVTDEAEIRDDALAAVRDLSPAGASVFVAGVDGHVHQRLET